MSQNKEDQPLCITSVLLGRNEEIKASAEYITSWFEWNSYCWTSFDFLGLGSHKAREWVGVTKLSSGGLFEEAAAAKGQRRL
eukprot:1777986-Amphidinium_carterae.1